MLRKAFLIFLAVGLSAACSRESKAKDAGLEEAKLRLERRIAAEADELIADRKVIRGIYLSTILRRSELEIESVSVEGARATVAVRVRVIPKAARTAVLEMIARHDRAKDQNLNLADLLRMTFQQLKLEPDERSVSVEKVLLKDDDGWKVVTPAG